MACGFKHPDPTRRPLPLSIPRPQPSETEHLVCWSQQGWNQQQMPAVTQPLLRVGRKVYKPCLTQSLSAIKSGCRQPPYDPSQTCVGFEAQIVPRHT